VSTLSHLDDDGALRMVDVSEKEVSLRRAVAEGVLHAGEDVIRAVKAGDTPKGNVYEVARIAGIMAAKRCAEIIPLCHVLPLDHVKIDFRTEREKIYITAEATARARTGVEMEALTAASVAGLTLYDMLKALSKRMRLEQVRLREKSGGRSGHFRADEEE